MNNNARNRVCCVAPTGMSGHGRGARLAGTAHGGAGREQFRERNRGWRNNARNRSDLRDRRENRCVGELADRTLRRDVRAMIFGAADPVDVWSDQHSNDKGQRKQGSFKAFHGDEK
jgi:hypothetical protein